MVYNSLPSYPFKKVEHSSIIDNTSNHHKRKDSVDISKNKYIISMEEELMKTQKYIENNKYGKSEKKTIEILKEALIQVFTNNRFMVNQLIKINTVDTNNEYDLKRALENIKQLNIICESIYMDE